VEKGEEIVRPHLPVLCSDPFRCAAGRCACMHIHIVTIASSLHSSPTYLDVHPLHVH
jgi:hypothetical protein